MNRLMAPETDTYAFRAVVDLGGPPSTPPPPRRPWWHRLLETPTTVGEALSWYVAAIGVVTVVNVVESILR